MAMNRSMQRLALLAISAAALTGCGSESSDNTAAEPSTPAPSSATGPPSSLPSTSVPQGDWQSQVGAICDSYLQGLGDAPVDGGTAAEVDAFVKTRIELLTGLPDFDSIDVPPEHQPDLKMVNDLQDAALVSLDAATQAAAAGDMEAAYTSLIANDDQATRVAQTWVLADVPCAGVDISRAKGAALNVALEMKPAQLSAGFGSIWVAEALAGRLVRIDPNSGSTLATIDVEGGQFMFKAQPASGSMWQRTNDGFVRIDPVTNTVTGTLTKAAVGPDANRSWAVDGAMWICDGRKLHRYDPLTITPVTVIDLDIDCGQVYATSDLVVVWTYNEDDGESGSSAAAFIDPATDTVIKTVDLPVDVGVPVELETAVFFPGFGGSQAVVVDRSTWAVAATPELGRETGASQSGFDGKFIYVVTFDHEDVLKVDATSYSVTGTIAPIHANTAIVADGALWTADGGQLDVVQRFTITS
jgi:hypothetical protein